MLCQCCGKNPATTNIKIISNGKLAEYALCPECALQLGCGNFLAMFGFGLGELGSAVFTAERSGAVRCGCCGSTLGDIMRSGRAGCPQCYRTFYDRLLPIIRQIHGSGEHRGKRPGASLPQVQSGGKLAVRGGTEESP